MLRSPGRYLLASILALSFRFALAEEPIDYARQIKPLLATRCYACHGALKQQGSLRLDTAAAALAGGDSGAAITPGKSAESELVLRISETDVDLRMPPEGEGSPLNAEEIALISAWIAQGAQAPENELPEPDPREHWAFQAPLRPVLPLADSPAAAEANPIDRLLAVDLSRHKLVPAPAAEKRILLRRVYLDLVGLPPTAQETEDFLADTTPDAFEKVVNKLLESPQYGERWGRHWMDVWRYSDWWGLGDEVRNSQKHIWHWRDWIVESLNDDVGYDEMLRQMLAADELYPNDIQKLRASGFLARQYFKFNRNSWLEETVEHTSKAFLGMTLNCARCHDHKYDPIAQRDYYRYRAFFEPYQVRTEQLPGTTDYEQNGIPRAFDCNLTAPTYLFIRGDDKRPRTEEPLTPGLPPLLAFEDLNIEPVSLPPEAYHPELRPWVLANHLQLAESQLATAQQQLAKSQTVLAALEKLPTEPAPTPVSKPEDSVFLVRDDFSQEKPELWNSLSGEWKYAEGKLVQNSLEEVRGVLQLNKDVPADFQARFQFTTTGGKQWRSVGLSFDLAGEHDVLAYLSAYAGGPKLQVAYKQSGGSYVYPENSSQNRPVKLGELQDVTIRVRGTLINIEIAGEPALAYRLPIERSPGKLALITYDAQATFSSFELSKLPAEVKLAEPMIATPTPAPSTPVTPEQARAAVSWREAEVAAANFQLTSLQARAAADQARWQEPAAADLAEKIRAAAIAEKQLAHLQAVASLAKLEAELLSLEPAQRTEKEKGLPAARESVAQTKQALENPGENYTSLSGALKTLESNVESAEHRNLPFPNTSTGRRTALARWMTDRRHPTTARVAVNHIWLRHMGAPLVPTVFEFGRKGSAPTHPQLLDFLAVELMENSWSMKHLHRLIVTSQAYRRSSSARDSQAAFEIDPENRYYWRMNATRLESEALRDSLLHLAGELDLSPGGPSIPLAQTENSKRRALYFVHSHNEHARWLTMFDDANVLDCYRRDTSIVPQQALALANSRLALESAEKIARRVGFQPASEKPIDNVTFIRRAYSLLLGSEPKEAEIAACTEALAEWEAQGLAAERTRVNLVLSLINHNDFVTVR